MGIFDTLKRLIFPAKVEPLAQVTAQAKAQPEQAHSSKADDSAPRFSESDMLAVKQRAETAVRVFNETLSIANQSKDRGAREYKLQIARERLIGLKQLANEFPFLHLTNLQAAEAGIIEVEAETRSMSYSPGFSIPREIDSSVTSDKCWVGPNKEVDVKELGSIGGMLYYGQGLASVQGSDVEPALINPKLRVVWPQNGSADHMPYWPSYSRISEVARGEYLMWLLKPFQDEVDKYKQLSLLQEADLACRGILKGIYDFHKGSSTEYKQWAVDAPSEYFGVVLDDWKKLFTGRPSFPRMTAFLQTHCPDWAEWATKSLRSRRP